MSKPMRILMLCVLCAVAASTATVALAEALVKPMPSPDLSKLPPEAAKELTDTRAEFEKARAGLIGPLLAQAYAAMAATYARFGLNDLAATGFYDAAQISPKDGRWPYLQGVIARALKRDSEARGYFEAALKLDPVYLPIRYRLADTLFELGDLDGARKLLDDVLREHQDQVPAYAMLGQIALKQKRYGDAIESLNRALKLEPAANELYKYLADANAAQGNAQVAQEARAKIGGNPPEMADPLVAGMYSNAPRVTGTPIEQAIQLVQIGDFDGARARVDAILRAKPDDVDALALAARIEAAAGNSAIAQAIADQALKLAPESAMANLSKGLAFEFGGDDAKAYEFYSKAVRIDLKLADARLLLGNAEMRRAHFPQAAEQYRQLAALQPDNANAYARLAAAQVAAGKCGAALGDINAALTQRPKDGVLLQVFVRVASTCPAAKQAEREMALDYAKSLYKQRPDASDSAALAIALAAQGKFQDAQQYQAQAIFEAMRAGDTALAALYRTGMQRFEAKQALDLPWPAEHPYFKPPLLAPAKPADKPTAKPKAG